MMTLPKRGPRIPHGPPGWLLGAALIVSAAGAIYSCTGCAAALPFVAPITEGLVAVIEAEAQRAGVPPGDPAYQAALAAARALELEAADASAQTQARLDAIVAEMHQRRTNCRVDAGPAAVFSSAPAALPVATASLVAIVDAGGDAR